MAELMLDNAVDVYCHAIARIDALGPCRRLIFTIPDAANPGYQNVVVKLIMTAELLATLSYLAANAEQNAISPAKPGPPLVPAKRRFFVSSFDLTGLRWHSYGPGSGMRPGP